MRHTALRRIVLLGLGLLCASVLVATAGAQAGALDPSFGTGGTVTTDFGGDGPAVPSSVAIQADGKIVAAGFAAFSSATPRDEFALARYASDGALDATFGDGGKVQTDFDGRDDHINAIALQSDGRIVAAGTGGLEDGTAAIELARYTSNGQLDPSFGSGGKVVTDLGAETVAGAAAVAIQANGRIVIAGTRSNGAGVDFMLARYMSNGRLDAGFGRRGIVLTDLDSGSGDLASAIALQGSTIIVAGSTAPASGGPTDFALARYTSKGRLDTRFGSGGKVRTDFSGGSDDAYSLALQGDGRIVVAGASAPFGVPSDVALARYESDGRLDTSFGSGGLVVQDFTGTGADDRAAGVAVQTDGKIVVGVGRNDFTVARYDTLGRLDSSFGGFGVAQAFFEGGSFATDVAIQSDGRIVQVGGAAGAFGSPDFAVARYLAS
jgi:uncharacterized delta-60 repeat protein